MLRRALYDRYVFRIIDNEITSILLYNTIHTHTHSNGEITGDKENEHKENLDENKQNVRVFDSRNQFSRW